MRHLRTAALAALLTLPASAQGLLDAICDAATQNGETATADEYAADPLGHADDFCALARFEPHKAAAQLGKMIRTTRARENRNRHYFDPLRGDDPTVYIQLLRPWMRSANERGSANWTVSQSRSTAGWQYQFFTIHNAMADCSGFGAHHSVRITLHHFPSRSRVNCGDYVYAAERLGDVPNSDEIATELDCPTTPSKIKADVERILDDQSTFPPCAITN